MNGCKTTNWEIRSGKINEFIDVWMWNQNNCKVGKKNLHSFSLHDSQDSVNNETRNGFIEKKSIARNQRNCKMVAWKKRKTIVCPVVWSIIPNSSNKESAHPLSVIVMSPRPFTCPFFTIQHLQSEQTRRVSLTRLSVFAYPVASLAFLLRTASFLYSLCCAIVDAGRGIFDHRFVIMSWCTNVIAEFLNIHTLLNMYYIYKYT